jgi:hypothetical protein
MGNNHGQTAPSRPPHEWNDGSIPDSHDEAEANGDSRVACPHQFKRESDFRWRSKGRGRGVVKDS